MSVRFGEISGWRAWRVWHLPEEKKLTSVVMCSRWEPGVPMEGNPDKVTLSSTGNYVFGEGVYAVKERKRAEEVMNEYLLSSAWWGGQEPWYDISYILGTVEMWGIVQEHASGYRAQYAIPTSFSQIGTSIYTHTKQTDDDLLMTMREMFNV